VIAERELDGKVVVITGAANGLGRAYAHACAAAGAAVVINDVDEQALTRVVDEIAADGGRARAHAADIAQHDCAVALREIAMRDFGSIDGLINNAGIRPTGAAWEEDPEQVRRAVEVNFLGALLCGIEVLKVMREQGSGSVVNVSSRAQSGVPASATYSATKGALASLTYSWALDMEPLGVRVNAVAPQAGGTATRNPATTRPGEPTVDDMTPLVTYLLSDRSRMVTGQVIRMGRSRPPYLDLALMSHPGTTKSYANPEGWSVAALATLFDHTLGAELEPYGANPVAAAYRILDGVPVLINPAIGI
jgi:NAD(P)-dependent dehydrogenase (short-subunit alcohol dehydrogenase family)